MKNQSPVNTITIKAGSDLKKTIEASHKAFRASDSFYKQLVASLNDYCVFTTDKKGIISSWNNGAEKLLGYSEKEIVGQNISIIYTSEDQVFKIHLKEMHAAKTNGRAQDVRWHVKKDNKRFWGSGLVFPLKDEKKKMQGYIKIMQDFTDAKAQELRLKESEAFSKSVFNSSPDSVKVLHPNGNLIAINEAGIKMMEVDNVDEHIGKLWFHFWDDQYSRDLKRAISVAKKGGVGRFQGTRATMKGTYKWWDVSVSPILDSKGKVIQLLSVSRDITEQKNKEAERKNLISELEIEKKKLTEIFKNAPAFLAIIRGKNYVYEMANKPYFELVGRKDIIGKTVLECFPELEEQGFINLLDYVFTTGKPLIGKDMKMFL